MNPEPISQLADVELPLPPDWTPWLVAGAALICIGAILFWLALRLVRTPRTGLHQNDIATSPEQEWERLFGQWQGNEVPAREMAYRVATLLRLGLELPQLDTQPPACIVSYRERWPELMRELAAMRYQHTPSYRLHSDIVAVVRTWLQEARTRP